MFENLAAAAEDPILSLMAKVSAERRPEKLDLGIGVYIDETGKSPVMSAVRAAEQVVWRSQTTKAYQPAKGNPDFLELLGERVFSPAMWRQLGGRVASMQTTGCVAALRLGGEVLRRSGVSRIWVPEPTWPIHTTIYASAGLTVESFPYCEAGSEQIDWERMQASLAQVQAGDAFLLHGSCHNPSGVDPSLEQWREIAKRLQDCGAIAFVDIAYAGLGDDWEQDLAGVRSLVAIVSEAIVAISCSKSFGLYRERTGALFFLGEGEATAQAALSNGLSIARTSYSMSPDHGAAVVAAILADPALEADWLAELANMRARIRAMRAELVRCAAVEGTDWTFLLNQKGMFSLLPLTPEQVGRLREQFAIYMPANGRICLPGLTEPGCQHLARSVHALT
jgi:aromatic-amino-acid transaminase